MHLLHPRQLFSAVTPPVSARAVGWAVWGLLLYLASIWPVPNGMLPFHRNFALYLIFLGVLWLLAKQPSVNRVGLWQPVRPVVWLLAALSLWILGTGLLHSGEGLAYLRLFQGKWLRLLFLGVVGLVLVPLFAGRGDPATRGPRLLFYLLAVMWLLPLAQALDALWLWYKWGSFPWQQTRIAYSRMELSVHVNLVTSFLFAELAARLVLGRRWLPVATPGLAAMIAVSLFGGLSLATRNATVGLAAMVLSITLLVCLYRLRDWRLSRVLATLIAGVGILLAIAFVSLKSDPRWQSLVDTVPIALDTERNLAWRDREVYPLPMLPSGEVVNESNYSRIAWLKIGSGLLLKEPWGQGFSAQNFHRLVEMYYGPSGSTSQAHSGVINFALAHGLPGLALWLALVVWLMRQGAQAFYRDGKESGLFLLMFVLGLTGRSLVDDVLRDHMLEMFFFFSGLLLALCHYEHEEPAAGPRGAA